MASPKGYEVAGTSESLTPKSEFGGVDEKHPKIHETGLSPQSTENSGTEGSTEDLTAGQKRSLSFAKYMIFIHIFLWLLFTG
jgi:hypothetical protein